MRNQVEILDNGKPPHYIYITFDNILSLEAHKKWLDVTSILQRKELTGICSNWGSHYYYPHCTDEQVRPQVLRDLPKVM